MEGPTVYMAKNQLQPFIGRKVKAVSGSAAIDTHIFRYKEIKDIFSWGKHLVFQFDDFALRVHFMLIGTFEAEIDGTMCKGDYPKTNNLTLKFDFDNGFIDMYSANVKFHHNTSNLKKEYDFSVDIMSDKWDESAAFEKVMKKSEADISDVLLDQKIFSGVGNKMRNEVLFNFRIMPTRKVKDIDVITLRELVKATHDIGWQFYDWRMKDELNTGEHWNVYKKKICPVCGGKITHAYTGKQKRSSYFCEKDQK